MNCLSLFSGVGLHDLGLERAGFKIVGQCEWDPWCQAVLEKHWPSVWRHSDIRELSVKTIRRNVAGIDLLTGGFPCQDISVAGRGEGLKGEKSGLWWEMHRIIDGLRPHWLLIENVPALRLRGADGVLDALERLGYSCWPLVVGAWQLGAPHKRERAWITCQLANCNCDRCKRQTIHLSEWGPQQTISDALGAGQKVLDVASSERLERYWQIAGQQEIAKLRDHGPSIRWPLPAGFEQYEWECDRLAFPRLGGTTPVRPRGMDGFIRRSRIKALGNANPWIVPYLIGRWILSQ